QAVTTAKPMPAAKQDRVVTAQPVLISDDDSSASVKSAKYASAQDDSTEHQRAKSEQPVRVRDVNVSRGPQGMEVQITASGPMQPEAMRLENPDRVVIDLPNAMWTGAPRQIAVKAADVKDVRMALYQLNPPVTRVVVDLT